MHSEETMHAPFCLSIILSCATIGTVFFVSSMAQPYATLMAVPLSVASLLLLIAEGTATSNAFPWRCDLCRKV